MKIVYMAADSQSIALLTVSSSTLNMPSTLQRARRSNTRRMKNEYADLQAHQYIWLLRFLGAHIFSSRALVMIYPIMIPVIRPKRASPVKVFRNAGEYRPVL